jgi:hypothetical protein
MEQQARHQVLTKELIAWVRKRTIPKPRNAQQWGIAMVSASEATPYLFQQKLPNPLGWSDRNRRFERLNLNVSGWQLIDKCQMTRHFQYSISRKKRNISRERRSQRKLKNWQMIAGMTSLSVRSHSTARLQFRRNSKLRASIRHWKTSFSSLNRALRTHQRRLRHLRITDLTCQDRLIPDMLGGNLRPR